MKSEILPKICWESLNDGAFRLRPGLRFRNEGPGNDFSSFLEDEDLGRCYAMSNWQRWLIELIEGKTPAQDAARLVINCFPELVSRDMIVRFIGWLAEETILQRVSTLDLKTGHREERVNLSLATGISRFRMLKTPFFMNAVAVALVALGIWTLNPSIRFAFGQPQTPLAVTAGDSPVVRIEADQVVPIRATSTGVLTEVLVRDGDRVDVGDIVARIEDPIAMQNLQDLKRALGECRIRRDRYYLAGNREKYAAELHRIADFSRRIGGHEADVTLAEMRAPVAGLVETEMPGSQIGAKVARGDVLLVVHLLQAELLAGNP